MDSYFQNIVTNHCDTITQFFTDNQQKIYDVVDLCEMRLKGKGKFLAFGNGGSSSDVAHFVAELVGRFEKERHAISAYDLTSSNATVTAIANDYGYDELFARQIEAHAQNKDILLGVTTSGSSKNVLRAFRHSRDLNLKTLNIMLTSQRLPKANVEDLQNGCVDFIFQVPSDNTARIQECHIVFLHVLAQLIEDRV